MASALNMKHDIIPDDKMTPVDKIKLKALGSLNSLAAELTKQPLRPLKMGVSENFNGWTDGSTFIAINKNMTDKAFQNGMTSLQRLFPVLVHEYCHESASINDHGHDSNFDRRMREAFERMIYSNELPYKSHLVYQQYFSGRRRQKMAVPSQELQRVYRDWPQSIIHAAYGNDTQPDTETNA